MTLNRLDEAKIPVKQLLELDPDNPKYWYKYASILDVLRDCDVVPAMDLYVSLCQDGDSEGCFQDGIDWAKNASNLLKKNHCQGG
jgi:hypothetical protein